MKYCKNHPNKKMLAFGLCRACYDGRPDQIKRRNLAFEGYVKLQPYMRTPEFKSYVSKYKQTEEYKKYNMANIRKWKAGVKNGQTTTGVNKSVDI